MATMNIRYSSEMMTNYVHAEIISPQKKFAALQTSEGLSLLFSIGTDDVLWLIRETSGQSAAGWTKTDLSSALLKNLESGILPYFRGGPERTGRVPGPCHGRRHQQRG
jgi:hypothetical protein